MKKQLALFILFFYGYLSGIAQIKWADTTRQVPQLEWNNYSTSYLGKNSDTVPILVTAIPYDGIYNMADRSALDMDFIGSAFRFRSNLEDRYRKLFTYSPSEVHFMVPGIFARNAAQYEFRVLVDDSSVLQPWSNITRFVDDDFRLNNFNGSFAFLGGYKTTWDHYLVLELRKKGQTALTAASAVYWKQTRPELINVFTSNELNEFLLQMKRPYDLSTKAKLDKWKDRYPPEQIDSATHLPKKLELQPNENSLIFFLSADIYKKEALEHRLLKDGNEYRKWAPNEYDNSLISLKDLEPGNYSLEMRYRQQPQNITAYPFLIRAAWYQTLGFKLLAALLVISSVASLILALKLQRQKRKTAAEQARKEKHLLGLKTIHSQLNPHFIFNALSSIQGLINNNEIDAANRYLSDFGSLIRSSLTDSATEFIPLEKEINTLDTYLKLEQLRFNFTYDIQVDPDIQASSIETPSLLLQPLVENAVKHGVSGKREKGSIHIEIKKQGLNLFVAIEDNGTGFITGNESTGYGLKLTRDRISLLNEMYQDTPITMNIESKYGTGTIVNVVFKNWLA